MPPKEWIIVCNCGEQKWLLAENEIVCAKCNFRYPCHEVFTVNEGSVFIDMDLTNRVKQEVNIIDL